MCKVKNGVVEEVAGVASQDLSGVVRKNGSEQPSITAQALEAPVEAGQVVAMAKFEGSPKVTLLVKVSVPRKLDNGIVTGAFGAMFVGGYLLIRRKRTKIYENN